MSLRGTSSKFWRDCKEYPQFSGARDIRHRCELNMLLPELRAGDRVLDVGCADGALMGALLMHVNLGQCYGCDIAETLARLVPPGVSWTSYDAYDGGRLPEADFAICGGVAHYLDDAALARMLGDVAMASPKIYFRAPCSPTRTSIDCRSDALGANYAATYRTRGELTEMLDGAGWEAERSDRIYPDEIESAFGTRQYYFLCNRKH